MKPLMSLLVVVCFLTLCLGFSQSADAADIAVVPPVLAQGEFDGGAAGAGVVIILLQLVIVLVSLAVTIWILISLYQAAAVIPVEHQMTSPGMVFTLLIPCVNIIMNFIVIPNIAKGFQSYFNAQGRTDEGDCGAQMAIIMAVLALIPCLNIVGFILLIVLTLKFNGYKKEIQGTA